jgi:hypothetical protein
MTKTIPNLLRHPLPETARAYQRTNATMGMDHNDLLFGAVQEFLQIVDLDTTLIAVAIGFA